MVFFLLLTCIRWGSRVTVLDDYFAGALELFCGPGADAAERVFRSTIVRGGALVFYLFVSGFDDVGEGTSVVDIGVERGSAGGALGWTTVGFSSGKDGR